MGGSTTNRISRFLVTAGVAVLAFAALKPPVSYHPVTATMSEAAGTMAGRRATTLEADGTDGRPHSPATDSERRPLVLFFIQDGCPCSEAADPYFRQLHAAYGSRASFLGVIDGDLTAAREWSARHGTPYPILADPERRIISACKAERSAYVMLVARGGAVEALWPGYSSRMLAEVGARLARLTGTAQIALDTRGAPPDPVSGCPF
jgi:peroxiredoxin